MSPMRRLFYSLAAAFFLLATACTSPESKPASNTLNWTARTETGVYGYLVYRSQDRAGPYRRIDSEVIRVRVDGLERHEYTYEDHDVEAGQTYFYYLDAVSDDGLKQRFSGIISRTAAEPSDS